QRALERERVTQEAPMPGGSKASFASRHESGNVAGGPIGFVARGGLSSHREVQALLRQRLRLLSIFSCGALILYIPFLWTFVGGTWRVVAYGIIVVLTAVFAVVLSSHRLFSLRALRRVEAFLTAGMLLFCVWKTTEVFGAVSL